MARLYLSGQNDKTVHLLKIFFYEKKKSKYLNKKYTFKLSYSHFNKFIDCMHLTGYLF